MFMHYVATRKDDRRAAQADAGSCRTGVKEGEGPWYVLGVDVECMKVRLISFTFSQGHWMVIEHRHRCSGRAGSVDDGRSGGYHRTTCTSALLHHHNAHSTDVCLADRNCHNGPRRAINTSRVIPRQDKKLQRARSVRNTLPKPQRVRARSSVPTSGPGTPYGARLGSGQLPQAV